jgi:hypothetical protein
MKPGPHAHGFALPPRSALEQLVDDVVAQRVPPAILRKGLGHPPLSPTAAAFMDELTPAVKWLVGIEVDKAVVRELSRRTYFTVESMKRGVWTLFEAQRRLTHASYTARGLDTDQLEPFQNAARADLANMLREVEAKWTTPHAGSTPTHSSTPPVQHEDASLTDKRTTDMRATAIRTTQIE